MIPLMYVLPSDAIYTSASGVITKITPRYSHYRNSIQIEFKYNLDEFFYLEIGLNKFDQPSEISLYGFYSSQTIQVDETTEKYHLIGKKVSIILTKEVILEIANNLVSASSFEAGSTIDFQIIQDKQKLEDRAVISQIELLPASIELTINGQDIVYLAGTKSTSYQPTLFVDNTTIVPKSVDGQYNIFDLPSKNDGLSLVIIPPQDFSNHYLFRQEPSLKHLYLSDNGSVSFGSTEYFYNNGLMEYFGMAISMQKFLTYGKDEDYKEYVFNIARDKNLYSEISLLFPTVKHNSMTVYDFKENVLIKGQVNYFSVIDGETDRLLHCISMDKCRDFFGRSINKKFEFKYLPGKVLTEDISSIKNAGLIGNVYVTDADTNDTDVLPVDTRVIDFQSKGYITTSNNRYSVSIKKDTMIRKSMLMRGNFKNFKEITGGDFVSPLYKIDTIDFDDNTISVKNGTKTITQMLTDKDALLISKEDTRLDTMDHMSDFAGVEFNISPNIISTSGINITNFSDYLMLCRMVEEPTYGIKGVRRDTKDLIYSLTFSYENTDITAIYNIQADKIYYINFAKKETITSPTDLPFIFSEYISSIDETKLKSFLQNGGTSAFKAHKTPNSSYVTMHNDTMYVEEVMHEHYLDEDHNMTSLLSSSLGITPFENLASSSEHNGSYIPRPAENSVMKQNFGNNTSIFRKAMTGVYANKPINILSVSIADSTFNLEFIYDGATETISFSTDGGSLEIKKGLKSSIFSDEEIYSYVIGCTYTSSILYDNLYQRYGVLVASSGFGVSLGLDINLISHMILQQTLGINETLSLSYDNRMFMLSGNLGDSCSIDDGTITCGNVTVDTDVPSGSAKALSFNDDIVTTVSNDDYNKLLTSWPDKESVDNNFVGVDEFVSDGTYSLSFDINKAQYLQFKE